MARLHILSGSVLVGLALASSSFAQPAKRTILQQADVAASPPQQTIFGKVEIAPGSGNPFQAQQFLICITREWKEVCRSTFIGGHPDHQIASRRICK